MIVAVYVGVLVIIVLLTMIISRLESIGSELNRIADALERREKE